MGALEGVREGCVVACSASRARGSGTERLVVLAETRLTRPGARQALAEDRAETCATLLGMPPDDVVLAAAAHRAENLERQVRRSAARALYEGGLPTQRQRSLWWQVTWLTISGPRQPRASRSALAP